jgi:hypothetical protein
MRTALTATVMWVLGTTLLVMASACAKSATIPTPSPLSYWRHTPAPSSGAAGWSGEPLS